MNAIMIGVLVMLILSVARVHVVLSLVVGAFAGGLAAGLPLADVVNAAGDVTQKGVMTHFQDGLAGGAGFCLLAISILMASSSIMAANIFIRCALGKPETK